MSPIFALLTLATANPPPISQHVAFARWMASELTWGTLSTTSSRSEGSKIGDAFGNPYSFASVDGVPYFFASDMDGSMTDLFSNESTTSRASLSLSEASLQGPLQVRACKIGSFLGDPENPPCARLTLSGVMSKLPKGSAEETVAKKELFSKHPSFKNYPPGHEFVCCLCPFH